MARFYADEDFPGSVVQIPWEIPDDVAADLDAWEKQLNQHGFENRDSSVESAFP